MPVMEPTGDFIGRPVKLVPQGWSLVPVPGWEPVEPDRIAADLVFRDLVSFMDYVNKFKNEDTLLLAHRDSHSIRAIIDYHRPTQPKYCQHKAKLELQPDPHWDQWLKFNGKEMEQEAFAEFLEDHLRDIVSPAAADLMAAVNAFTVEGSLKFSRIQRTLDGTVKFELLDERKASIETVVMGDKFGLRLRAYRGQETPRDLGAKLRYRLSKEGDLTLWYVLKDVEEFVEESWFTMCGTVEEHTELKVFEGTKTGQ